MGKVIVPNAIISFSFQDALVASSVEGVAMATPAETHHPLPLEALQAGGHIFVEKPLAVTVDHSQEIFDESNKAGRIPKYDQEPVFANN